MQDGLCWLTPILTTDAFSDHHYKKHAAIGNDVAAIAIDSTGLKRLSRGEWRQEKHKLSPKNCSELTIFRYKKILGDRLHATEFSRQKNEVMLGCGILNKMASLGMPQSYRCV